MGLFDNLKKKVIDKTGLDPFPEKDDFGDLKKTFTDVTGMDPFSAGKKTLQDIKELKNPLKDTDSVSESFDKIFNDILDIGKPAFDGIRDATFPEAASRIHWEAENGGPDKIFEQSGAGSSSLVIRLSARGVTLCPSADDELHFYYENRPGLELEIRKEGNVTYVIDPDKSVMKELQQVTASVTQGDLLKAEIPSGKGFSVDIAVRGLPNAECDIKAADLDLHALRVSVHQENVSLERLRVAGGIGVSTTHDIIIMKDVTAGGAALVTTNEKIRVQNCSLGKLSANTCNSKVEVIDTRADQIFLDPENSAIHVDGLESGDITFLTDMGSITGTIRGKKEDWEITSRAEGLINTLPKSQPGGKPLVAIASEGTIRLSFRE